VTVNAQNLLTGAANSSIFLRDYTHASKIFRSNSYQNAPKLKFLFHVYFEINESVYKPGIATGANFGIVVKTINLPKFAFDTHVMNQYNRKRLVQTKIKYNPVTISFHDDNGDMINDMWYNYYTYYYKDANKIQVQQTNQPVNGDNNYNYRNIYSPDISSDNDWGYIGESTVQTATESQAVQSISKIPFFKNIRIYGFNQHNFVEYVLINPIITSFEHDTYDYSQGNGVMENKMTIDYETVKYYEGAVSGPNASNQVPGFGEPPSYDRNPSPLAPPGSTSNVLGPQGLVESPEGYVKSFQSSTNETLVANQQTGTQYNTTANPNLVQTATQNLNNLLSQSAQGQLQARTPAYFPGYGTSPSIAGTAGAPTTSILPIRSVTFTEEAVPPGRQTA
jgi:hypothetical protein